MTKIVSRLTAVIAGCALATAIIGIQSPHVSQQLPLSRLTTLSAQASPDSTSNTTLTAQTSQAKKRILAIANSTSIVTSDSGYSADFTITNNSNQDVSAGSLSVYIAPNYEFKTSDSLQEWAESDSNIRMSHELAQADVRSLKVGESTTIKVHVDANNPVLSSMITWGARPLLIRYQSHDSALAESIHSFITRSNAGTHAQSLPALNVVFTVPISSGNMSSCITNDKTTASAQESMSALLSGEALSLTTSSSASSTTSSSTPSSSSSVSSPSGSPSSQGSTSEMQSCTASAVSGLEKLKNTVPQVELLTDPSLALNTQQENQSIQDDQSSTNQVTTQSSQSSILNSSSYSIQPYAIDIASLANSNNTSSLSLAAATSVGSSSPIAIDGLSGWSMDALKTAQSLGYSTVLATDGFASATDSAVHNSLAHVDINGQNMTVLTAQHELSQLAQGTPSSSQADAENSSAGLINRFIAQTAFYESQAPYEQRTILINASHMSRNLSPQHIAFITRLAQSLSSASWTNLTDLNSLINASSPYSAQEVEEFIEDAQKLDKKHSKTLSDITEIIDSNKSRVNNFLSSVVDSAQSPTSAKDARNPQDLARGQADKSRPLSSQELEQWQNSLSSLITDYASRSLSSLSIATYAQNSRNLSSLNADTAITRQLLNSVNISVPSSLHVVSETATVPVTISNNLPVSLRINVATRSSEKVRSEVTISGADNITVNAHSEQQVTLPVRAISGWTTTFQIYITTAEGMLINSKKDISISSSFTIMDNAGYVIFALAILLAVLGIRRQISRSRSKNTTDSTHIEDTHSDSNSHSNSHGNSSDHELSVPTNISDHNLDK
ncbi:hypothetical protein EJ419_04395 [Alloscardovia theropitheci]|uniref:Uncharacterized protein n=1 Tax=Alloscardovia theropitheci TaxID=2496842 RepID=A0A4R0QPU4_9BIFI|nr:DUF6049 family protein [Alloscardovia theropitheci]TCD54282.1 hypothetical protein EJ419_04395 [Alloscardovia theropitheci]